MTACAVSLAERRRAALLNDALRYLARARQHERLEGVARLYADWAAKALTEAGEADLAQIVVVGNDLGDPALFDRARELIGPLVESRETTPLEETALILRRVLTAPFTDAELRGSSNGRASAFQADDAGSNPVLRSKCPAADAGLPEQDIIEIGGDISEVASALRGHERAIDDALDDNVPQPAIARRLRLALREHIHRLGDVDLALARLAGDRP